MNKTILIIGMHRSGTSLISHLCCEMGMSLGKKECLTEADPGNTDGYWENKEFTELNDRVLEKAGGTWFNPPGKDKIEKVVDEFKEEAKKLVNKHKGSLWGIKDPRLIYTLPIYELKNVHIVFARRNVKNIINSIYRSHIAAISPDYRQIDRIKWLCEEYIERGAELAKQYPSAMVYYENFFKNPRKEIQKIADFLEYDKSVNSLKKIIKPELKHF